MSLGSVQNVLACVPAIAPQTSLDASLCGTDASGGPLHVQAVQAYVVSAANGSLFDQAAAPFDYSVAAQSFGAAFVVVVGAWMAAHVCGVILGFIKQA